MKVIIYSANKVHSIIAYDHTRYYRGVKDFFYFGNANNRITSAKLNKHSLNYKQDRNKVTVVVLGVMLVIEIARIN